MSANLIRTLCLILFIIGSAQELLMRQSYLQGQGSRAKPLFGVRGEPNTPSVGEAYTDDATSELHEQVHPSFFSSP
jgi:hypothetical protein